MVDVTPFELPREELEARLRFFERTYGPYVRTKGMQNWRNLFRKPTYLDWVMLFIVVIGLFMAWAYITDTNNIKAQCCLICEQNGGVLNLTLITGMSQGMEPPGDIKEDISLLVNGGQKISLYAR